MSDLAVGGQGTELRDSSRLYFQSPHYLRPGVSLPQAAAGSEFWTESSRQWRTHGRNNAKLLALHCQIAGSVTTSLFRWIGYCSGVNLIIFQMVESFKKVCVIPVSLAAWIFFPIFMC